MRKGKQKTSKVVEATGSEKKKSSKSAIEAAVNEGVKLQDAASKLSPGQAITTLQAAEAKYKTALISAQGHPEASYNLATCLSEQADVRGDLVGAEAAAGEQPAFFHAWPQLYESDLCALEDALSASNSQRVTLLGEARTILTEVITRDTSGRGATTALAHHALGNVIGSIVDLHRQHCPTSWSSCPLQCPSPAECVELLRESGRHFKESLAICNCQPTPPAGMDEVMVHWGDAEASAMRIAMEGSTVGRGDGDTDKGRLPWQSPPGPIVQEALRLCSNACNKYAEALNLESSTGGSDADTLLSRAGVVVDMLDWALPETLYPSITDGLPPLGFDPFSVLATGDHAVAVLLGLDAGNRGGLLAKGDLSRLRARATMLLGTALQDEGVWREASVQSFAMAVTLFPEDAEALASAGEGSLEYGRRGLDIYRRFALAMQGFGPPLLVPPGWDPEAMRASALARLQEAGVFLSRSVSSADVSETDSTYNAACAFALCGNEVACKDALTEYCRRVVANANTTTNSRRSSRPMDSGATVLGGGRKKESTKRILSEAAEDNDLEIFKNTGWFVELMKTAESAVVSEMQPWQSKRYMGL